MKIYGLKNCDTCRKAAKALPQAELIDIRQTPIVEEVLTRALQRFGDNLVNKRSTTWRGLAEEDRVRPAVALLREFPSLMKRPLIVSDVDNLETSEMSLGWDKSVQARWLS